MAEGGTQIAPYEYIPPVKSVGNGITCVEDLNDETEVWKVIFELSRKGIKTSEKTRADAGRDCGRH